MKKPYRIAIEKLFSAELKRLCPEFNKVSVKPVCKYNGEAVFASDAVKATLFISVIPHPKGHEEFTVEIGWSTKHRFPELSMRPNMFDVNELGNDEGMIRLTSFSKIPGFGWTFRGVAWEWDQKYWLNPEAFRTTPVEIIDQDTKRVPTDSEAVAAVGDAVTEAINELKTHGLPYLNKYLSL